MLVSTTRVGAVGAAITPAKERVLQVAEKLFMERGYTAVTMRDIADSLGMKQASLYNHAPDGKEQLFVEVVERNLEKHKEGMRAAIAGAASDLRAQLQAAARWLLSQPPMNVARITRSDMPEIAPDKALHISGMVFQALLAPIERAFTTAQANGVIRAIDPKFLSGMFVVAVESLHEVPRYSNRSMDALIDDTVGLFLDGVLIS